jgi:hypothetical protein
VKKKEEKKIEHGIDSDFPLINLSFEQLNGIAYSGSKIHGEHQTEIGYSWG